MGRHSAPDDDGEGSDVATLIDDPAADTEITGKHARIAAEIAAEAGRSDVTPERPAERTTVISTAAARAAADADATATPEQQIPAAELQPILPGEAIVPPVAPELAGDDDPPGGLDALLTEPAPTRRWGRRPKPANPAPAQPPEPEPESETETEPEAVVAAEPDVESEVAAAVAPVVTDEVIAPVVTDGPVEPDASVEPVDTDDVAAAELEDEAPPPRPVVPPVTPRPAVAARVAPPRTINRPVEVPLPPVLVPADPDPVMAEPVLAEPVMAEPEVAEAVGEQPAHTQQPAARTPHGSAADLALLRTDANLRARCVAGLLAPFAVYAVVMLVVGGHGVQWLLWIWIPTIIAGVLVGVFLDNAHNHAERRRAEALPK